MGPIKAAAVAFFLLLLPTVAWSDTPYTEGHRHSIDDGSSAYLRGDYEAARKVFRSRAEKGYAFAHVILGLMYYQGEGIPQNYSEALRWFRPAAEEGNALAQSLLGAMYGRGKAVPQDYVQAHMWLNLAAAQGQNNAAEARDRLAQNMTREQIAEAQRLAREWRPKDQKEPNDTFGALSPTTGTGAFPPSR